MFHLVKLLKIILVFFSADDIVKHEGRGSIEDSAATDDPLNNLNRKSRVENYPNINPNLIICSGKLHPLPPLPLPIILILDMSDDLKSQIASLAQHLNICQHPDPSITLIACCQVINRAVKQEKSGIAKPKVSRFYI